MIATNNATCSQKAIQKLTIKRDLEEAVSGAFVCIGGHDENTSLLFDNGINSQMQPNNTLSIEIGKLFATVPNNTLGNMLIRSLGDIYKYRARKRRHAVRNLPLSYISIILLNTPLTTLDIPPQ